MKNVIKTAIAIPKADYQKIETLRIQMGKTRSQLLLEAFHEWLRREDERHQEQRYQAGYVKHPEEVRSLRPYLKASLSVWAKEHWK